MKIAQLAFTPSYSGIAVMAWNIYERLNHESDKVDIICMENSFFSAKEKAINKNGSEYIRIRPRHTNRILKHLEVYQQLKKILREKEYDIVHLHGGSNLMNIIAIIAIRNKRIKIVAHSHNEENSMKPFNRIAKRIISKYADRQLACSEKAAGAMFDNDNWIYIRNGIDTKRFQFSEKDRKVVRDEFGIKDGQFFIGNVGRLSGQKNQLYLVKIFDKIIKTGVDAKLLIIGEGPLKNDIQNLIGSKGLSDKVIMIERSNEIPQILSALDFFLLPSLYEGLPVSAVESQANGLRTIISNTTSSMTIISDRCSQCGIKNCDIEEWARNIRSYPVSSRKKYANIIAAAGFDINDTVRQIGKIYENLKQ